MNTTSFSPQCFLKTSELFYTPLFPMGYQQKGEGGEIQKADYIPDNFLVPLPFVPPCETF